MIGGSPLFRNLGLASGLVPQNDSSDSIATDDPKTGTPADRIPLPNYNDPASRLQYAKAFTKKYGPLMQGRGDTPLRINEVPGWGSTTAKNMAISAAKKFDFDPALFYASAMEEGMSGLFKNEKGLANYSGDKDFPTEGSYGFGLDNFVPLFPELVKRGYLPADFKDKFKPVTYEEPGYTKNSANYRSPDDALMAKAAFMKYNQDEVDNYAKQMGIQLSPKARQFFTMINYNAGAGNGRKMLQDYFRAGALKDDAFLQNRPVSGPGLKSTSWEQPYMNIIRRFKMADALRNEGYFDDAQVSDGAKKEILKIAK